MRTFLAAQRKCLRQLETNCMSAGERKLNRQKRGILRNPVCRIIMLANYSRAISDTIILLLNPRVFRGREYFYSIYSDRGT